MAYYAEEENLYYSKMEEDYSKKEEITYLIAYKWKAEKDTTYFIKTCSIRILLSLSMK